jgi:hypothetical protein
MAKIVDVPEMQVPRGHAASCRARDAPLFAPLVSRALLLHDVPMLIPIAFLMLLAAAPFLATAQPRAKLWRVGYLSYSTEASAEAVLRAAFLEKLRTLGHIEGRSITIEYRYTGGRVERLGDLARELAALLFDVLVGGGIQASLAL